MAEIRVFMQITPRVFAGAGKAVRSDRYAQTDVEVRVASRGDSTLPRVGCGQHRLSRKMTWKTTSRWDWIDTTRVMDLGTVMR